MKQLGLFMAALLLTFSLPAQELYMPLEFKRAYEKKSRSMDGRPGENYRQNRSEYKIKAEVMPEIFMLKGQAQIRYFNDGKDTLRNPGFHTYHDMYRPEAKKEGFFSGNFSEYKDYEGVKISKLEVNGEDYDPFLSDAVRFNGTNYIIQLSEPLLPGEYIDLAIDWEFQIPGEGFERAGSIDSSSMFIAYWYPEMAVFDDIDGWDRIVYNGATEFYHDYSDYEVEITLPDNFLLWASAPVANPKEVYSKQLQNRIDKALKSEEDVRIYGPDDFKDTASGKKTWKFKAKDYPDFSFAISKHFIWEARVHKDKKFGDYYLHVAYPEKNPEFKASLEGMSVSLDVFHNDWPLVAFPYQQFVTFNGLQGGGMEFPGMANNQEISAELYKRYLGIEVSDMQASLGLTLHEMAHMYFPFLTGLHEKKYAWMDEGWASFSEYFIPSLYESRHRENPQYGSLNRIPAMTPSHLYEGSQFNSYTLGGQANIALYELLGEEVYFKSLKDFVENWKHKHPTPYDYFFTVNRVAEQDLNWFWKAWYFDWGYMDIGIREVSGNTVTIANEGGKPLNFSVRMKYADGSESTEKVLPDVWKAADVYTLTAEKEPVEVELIIPGGNDAKGSNNVFKKN
ncbi:MAG: hypothetical protein LAT68_05485 [Cyclobacteriaceae bacterium]|nr:hypothetical protein [Cyclobacteriaceae bacterium]MCH8515763.1 hypothetical protein [Cyclobacteriaceae bacterium]